MEDGTRRRSFGAMGTTIELTGIGVDAKEFDRVTQVLCKRALEWEQIFSRFKPDSELNRVNGSGGTSVQVSSVFYDLVEAAKDAHISTRGKFDPTIVDALEQAGYDRPFAEIANAGGRTHGPRALARRRNTQVLDIELNPFDGSVRLPEGVRLDLGGIAKGAYVDAMLPHIALWPGGIIDAGGDIVLHGTPADGGPWRVGVQHPGRLDEDIGRLELMAGRGCAVATSSTRSRRWMDGVTDRNHLIDPQTGVSVPQSTPSVTVVSQRAVEAEVEAKALLIGLARGEPVVATNGLLAMVAYEDGHYETFVPGQID